MPSTVTLRNQAAHMKHLNLGGSATINIPPTLDGEPGVAFTPSTEDEADRLVLALSVVKLDWIDTGELHVSGIDYGPAALEAAKARIQARAEAAKRAEEAKAQAGKVPPPPPPPPPSPPTPAPVDEPPTDEVPGPPPAAMPAFTEIDVLAGNELEEEPATTQPGALEDRGRGRGKGKR